MIKKILILSLMTSCLNGCAFGVSKLKVDYPNDLQLVPEAATTAKIIDNSQTTELEPGVNVSARWIGNAYVIPTAKSIFGLTNRYVIPYTKLTSLMEIKIVNNSDKYIDLNLKNIKLKNLQDGNEASPLTIDFFKNRWPNFAVKTQEMLIDQSVAIGDVIRTIARDKTIEPKSTYQGYLAFSRLPDTVQTAELNGLIKIDNKDNNLSLRFKKK